MGVQNLWVLLAPVGRQIEIESLEGKVLAVDASIWLTQFVKAMRDDEGNMIRNAHLVGTFHRVAKLLFFGVRPVFVFDGDTPEIKKRTTARRRKRQESQAANLRQTAQRILINRLKLHREEMKKNGGVAPAVDPSFVIPEVAPAAGKVEQRDDDDIEILEDDGDDLVDPSSLASASGVSAAEAAADEDNDGSVKSEEELTVDDIDLDTSHLSNIDLHAVFSLPPHLQKSMVEKIQRDRRQEVRDQFIPLAGQPEAYSHVQISSFLATVKLNRRIEVARRQKTQEELEAEKKRAEDEGSGSTGEHILGQGKRIASNSSKFFIYEKANDDKTPATQHSNRQSTQATENIISVSDDESGSEQELLTDIDKTADLESSAAGVETYGLSLDDRFRPNKRRRQMPRGGDHGKMSLSEFSAKDFAEQSEQRVQNEQERQGLNVREVQSSWIARHHIQAKQEPELAIEKARRERLGLPNRSASEGTSELVVDKPAVFSIEQTLSPQASILTKSAPHAIAIDKVDITTATARKTSRSLDNTLQAIAHQIAVASEDSKVIDVDAEDGDDDDDIEWEDVKETASGPKHADVPSALRAAEISGALLFTASTHQDPLVVATDQDNANNALSKDAMSTESESDNDEQIVEQGDEMMLTLRSEMEDAKAEEDLNLLKEEALHSAMVTASNLTQWAAGAVRRALAAHTQNHKSSPIPNRTTQSWTPTRNFPTKEATNRVIEIHDDEDEVKPVAASKVVSITDDDEKGEKMPRSDDKAAEWSADNDISDDQLQMALMGSIREESAATSSDKVRYLQYDDKGSPVPNPKALGGAEEKETLQNLEREQRELKTMRNRQQRDVEGVNDEMVQDVMELLRLFGVPYLVCPMEAEAQCAALEMLGLVDGIITDDSDIFPFGGKKVYKNIFHNQKFVEAFFAQDIQKELGFSREDIIALALLLGSDYTDGVRGIGIVNATEVVNAFPGIDGLREFKQWVHAFDLTEEASRAASKKKKADSELERLTPRERFEHTHASARRKWELGEAFPNSHVVQAYMSPHVDKSEERFSWNLPDLAGLRTFCTQTFGWDQGKADGVLLPLMERSAAAAAARNGRPVQTRIDQFFRSYDDQVKFAKIKSKRLRSAVEGRTQVDMDNHQKDTKNAVVVIENEDESDQAKSGPTQVTSKFFKKKKTSMSAVAGGKITAPKRKAARK